MKNIWKLSLENNTREQNIEAAKQMLKENKEGKRYLTDENKKELEHIGKYSKDKYWIHKDKSWDIKPCKRHPFDIKSKMKRRLK